MANCTVRPNGCDSSGGIIRFAAGMGNPCSSRTLCRGGEKAVEQGSSRAGLGGGPVGADGGRELHVRRQNRPHGRVDRIRPETLGVASFGLMHDDRVQPYIAFTIAMRRVQQQMVDEHEENTRELFRAGRNGQDQSAL